MKRWIVGLMMCVPMLASAQHSTRWSTNYYAVTGATLPGIEQSIRQSRPWKERLPSDAMTEWHVTWQYQHQAGDSGVVLHSFGTQTAIRLTMPRWQAPTNVEPAVRAEWEKYSRALLAHELGHARHGLGAAAEMYRQVWAMGAQPDAATLEQKLNGICNQVIEAQRKLDRDYDEKTGHGATEGARLFSGSDGGRTNQFRGPQDRRPRGGSAPR